MVLTGDTIHGWRVAKLKDGRRPMHGIGAAAWVDEPAVELIKGNRHVRATGQQGIDPNIVLARAVTAALQDDIRELTQAGKLDELVILTRIYNDHEVFRKIRERGHRPLTKGGAIFRAGTATSKGTLSGSNQ